MKIRKKLLVYILALMVMLGAVALMAVLVGAANTSASLRIAYCNLAFGEDICIQYAVPADAGAEVKLLIWTSPQKEYTLGTQDVTLTSARTETIEGVEHKVFDYMGLSAMQMTDEIYARAYTEEGGEASYSPLHKYSVLQYAYNMLGKTGAGTANEELKQTLSDMLAYGASVQKFCGYRTDRLPTMEYYQVVLENGTLDDGTSRGLFPTGETVHLNAPATDGKGEAFACWIDGNRNRISLNEQGEMTVGASNGVYTAVYGTRSRELVFISNGDGTCSVSVIGKFDGSAVVIPAESPIGDAVTAIDDFAFGNCKGLTDVTWSVGLARVGRSAFAGCSELANIHLNYTEEEWGILTVEEGNDPLLAAVTHFKLYADGDGSLIADPVTSIGMANALARAALWRDMEYTPKGTLYADNEDQDVMKAGDRVRGLWYSSTRGIEQFIGYSVSMESLMTALNNPRSVLYTRSYGDYFMRNELADGAANVYGTNCSQYVSWSIGLPYLTVTDWLPKLECFVNENGEHDTAYGGVCWDATAEAVDTAALQKELRLCDVMNSNYQFGGSAGHAVIVTGIRRDRNGLIREVDISEDWWASMRSFDQVRSFNCIKTTTYTWDTFVETYIVKEGYRVYRYDDLAQTPPIPDLDSIVYSDICTSRGDKVAIRPDQDITLNVVANAGEYAGIVLLRDGKYHSHRQGVADWRLIDPNAGRYPLSTGKYTAILYREGDTPSQMTLDHATEHNSTSFIVCRVTVTRDTSTVPHTYAYTAEPIDGEYPIPMQVELKGETGLTRHVHVLSHDSFDGIGNAGISYYGGNSDSIIHVPFKTEYGFVVAESKFDNQPLPKPALPEDEIYDPSLDTPVDSNEPVYSGGLGYVSNGDGTCYIGGISDTAATEAVIPATSPWGDKVTGIGDSAFKDCAGLTSVTLPNTVTVIGDSAFEGCRSLRTLLLPEKVTSIGEYAFADCSSLTRLTIPSRVTSIGDFAFYGCAGLTEITVPARTTDIGYGAFSGCPNLTALTVEKGNLVYHSDGNCLIHTASKTLIRGCKGCVIPDDGIVTSIGPSAFLGCPDDTDVHVPASIVSIEASAFAGSAVRSVTLAEGVQIIGHDAFSNCVNLTSITIPNSVTYVGEYAFCGCVKLASVTLSENLDAVDTGVFKRCVSLAEITIPAGVSYIGDGAFFGCESLTELVIPGSVLALGSGRETGVGGVFEGCTALTTVKIESGVASIGYGAFADCTALTRAVLPASVTFIGPRCFSNCGALQNIYYLGTQAEWDAIATADGKWNGRGLGRASIYILDDSERALSFTSNGDGTCYISGIGTCTRAELVIPAVSPTGDIVTGIGEGAFYNCRDLVSITIPDTVTYVGEEAFYLCTSLEQVILSEGLETIGEYAFGLCSALESIALPNSVTVIGDSAFRGCSELASVTLGYGVTAIGDRAFRDCFALGNVYYAGTEEQWQTVSVGPNNQSLLNAVIRYGTEDELSA
jgi:hypothetical protein